MTIKIWLKSGNVIELPNMDNVEVTKDSSDQHYTALRWTYGDKRSIHDQRLTSISLTQIEAVTCYA